MTAPATRGSFVVADVGSTTTKAVLFRRRGAWGFLRREAPTTVEAPHADVTVGLTAAIRALSEAAGEALLDPDGRPAVPLFLTSSAGGGLAMVVIGLVARVTTMSAERAALGAGAVVLDTIALDDGRVPYRKVEALSRLRPDMVLFAGGFDGDALSGPVLLAELLRQAALKPKLDPEALLPVVYAGNVNAEGLVRETLGDRYLIRTVPNIRPESERENLEPARAEIHEVFMEHVMSHAPGYGKLKDWVAAPLVPTPSAFARILAIASRERKGRILAVDVGGATTDVFTAEDGEVRRTVSANLGMSYSALNVVRSAGIEALHELLDVEMEPAELLDRIGNKHLRPTVLPASRADRETERAVATIAVREAVKEHLHVLSGAPISRGERELSLEALRRAGAARREPDAPLFLDGYDLVIGSGGVLSHSPRETAAAMLIDALLPVGEVELAVDSAFILPHLGVLSTVDPELAGELVRSLGVVTLGPFRTTGSTGEIRVAPPGPGDDLEVGRIEDGRGRPPVTAANPLRRPLPASDAPRAAVPKEPPVREGLLQEVRELAVPGEVLVEAGQRVEPETEVARCVRTFPRPFFLRPAVALGVEPHEVAEHLLVAVGDEVAVGDVVARRPRKLVGPREFRSQVRGRVERILGDGTVVLREGDEARGGARAVDVASELGIDPWKLGPYLQVSPGDEVEEGSALARVISSGGVRSVASPVRGTVARVDLDTGLVLLHPIREELSVRAWLPGTVVSTTDRGAVVGAEGTRIRGIWGSGGEAVGELSMEEFGRGVVVVLPRAAPGVLGPLMESGPAALVAGGLHLAEILEAAPPFPVVLTEGFGRREMRSEIRAALNARDGRPALVDATTELRVGVKRPRVLLPGGVTNSADFGAADP